MKMATTGISRISKMVPERDHGGMVEVAKAIYQKVVSDLKSQFKELEERQILRLGKVLEKALADMESAQAEMIGESVEQFKAMIKALPVPNVTFTVPDKALNVQVESPIQVNVPPPRLVSKAFKYDDLGRPLSVVETEIKEPSPSKE